MPKEIIEKKSVTETVALFSKSGTDRYLLRYTWDTSKKSILVIMTTASTSTELCYDQTCMLCHNGAVRNGFGSLSIVNLSSAIGNPTPKSDKMNLSIILEECTRVDCIMIAWGRGTAFQEEKEAMLEALSPFAEKLHTLIDSKSLPFAHPLSPYAHEWKIKKI